MTKEAQQVVKDIIYEAVTAATEANRKTTSNFWGEAKEKLGSIGGDIKGIRDHLAILNGTVKVNREKIERINSWRGEINLQDLTVKSNSFDSWIKGGLGAIGVVLIIGIGLITYIYKTETSNISDRLEKLEVKLQ